MTFTGLIATALIAVVILLGNAAVKGIREHNKIKTLVSIVAIAAVLGGLYFGMAYFITSM